MCVNMYVCAYVHACVCLCTCMFVCLCLCVHVCVLVCVCVCVRVRERENSCVHNIRTSIFSLFAIFSFSVMLWQNPDNCHSHLHQNRRLLLMSLNLTDYISRMSVSSYVTPVCEQMQCQTHTYKGTMFEVFGGMLHTEHSRGTVTTMSFYLLCILFC